MDQLGIKISAIKLSADSSTIANMQNQLNVIAKQLVLNIKNVNIAGANMQNTMSGNAQSFQSTSQASQKATQAISTYEGALNKLIHAYKNKEIADDKFLSSANKAMNMSKYQELSWQKQEQLTNLAAKAESNLEKVRTTTYSTNQKFLQQNQKNLQDLQSQITLQEKARSTEVNKYTPIAGDKSLNLQSLERYNSYVKQQSELWKAGKISSEQYMSSTDKIIQQGARFELMDNKVRTSMVNNRKSIIGENDKVLKAEQNIQSFREKTLSQIKGMEVGKSNIFADSRVKEEVQKLTNMLNTMGTKGGASVQQIGAQMEKLKTTVKQVGAETTQSLSPEKIKNFQTTMNAQIEKMKIGAGKIFEKSSVQAELSTLTTMLNSVGQKGGASIAQVNAQMSKFRTTVAQAGFDTKQLNKETNSYLGNLGMVIKKFLDWQIVATLVMQPIHKFQEAVKYIENMNAAFTTLQMEMTDAHLIFEDVLKTANNYALAMGTTTAKTIEAMQVFSTYTSTMDEVLEKSQAAIILSNITGQNISQTSDELMGTMAQFKLGAEDSLHVVDVIAGSARLLQMDYPKAIKEIASGLNTVGTVAKESKVPIELLSSMIGTLSEKTRKSGSEIANSLRTIFGRIQNVGEDADPESFKKIEKNLTELKVSIREVGDPDTLRPVGDILEDLAGKWSTLTDVQRQEIAMNAAGKIKLPLFSHIGENLYAA